MNTPKKKKRYVNTFKGPDKPGGHYTGGLHNPEIAAVLGMLVSEYVHLENAMARVLAALLGVADPNLAGYVMRSIRSPRGRIDMMRDLLEKAPRNQLMPDDYDKAIDEFQSLTSARNNFVHGEWHTHQSGEAFVAIFDEHGWGMLTARPVAKEELEAVRKRIGQHHHFVTMLYFQTQ